MSLPGRSRLRRAVGGLTKRRKPNAGSTVLMYHRVAESVHDPWGLCVSPGHFEEHLEVLRDHHVVSVDQIADGSIEAGSIALTLDDGYCDTVSAMLPAIQRAGLPITVYVTTGGLDESTVFWWDRLTEYVFMPVELPATATPGGVAPGTSRDELHVALWEQISRLNPVEQGARLDELAAWAGVSSEPAAELIDERGVLRLGEEPMVTIGAHTVHHRLLPDLDRAEREREICESSERLATLLDRPIRHFAYPNGRYDDATVAHVRELGFASAVTTDAGSAMVGADLHRLPREQVPDLDGDHFAAWLDELVGTRRRR